MSSSTIGSSTSIREAKPERPWRVAAVCPCFNRPQDLEILLEDFAKLDLTNITLWVTIVDNASTKPLSTLRRPEGLKVEFVRSEKNTGGSGGFNMGMSHVLSGSGQSGEMGEPDFVWWVDSDARVDRRCLRALIEVMASRSDVGAVGAGLAELDTGHVWEIGGNVYPQRGTFGVAAAGDVDPNTLIECDYVAACCALIRTDALRRTGLFPENFIYYDDIDWCVQMKRKTGYVCRATSAARAYHPQGIHRFATWARYYIARNGFSVLEMKGYGGLRRFRRAMFEIPRAVAQSMMGLGELAELHLRGLEDAAAGRFDPIEPKDLLKPIGMKPYAEFSKAVQEELAGFGPRASLYVHPFLHNPIPQFDAFREALGRLTFTWPHDQERWKHRLLGGHVRGDVLGAAWRALTGPSADVAIVPTGWPTNWFRGKVLFQVTVDGFLVRRVNPWSTILKGIGLYLRGLLVAARLAMRSPGIRPFPPAPARKAASVTVVREFVEV